jgi:hypothetical protein
MYKVVIANTLQQSVTIKEVKLRYRLDGKPVIADSHVLQTGSVAGSVDPAIIIAIEKPRTMVVLMGWKNLRPEIGEYRTLQPGAVLAGSALFVLGFQDVKDFTRVKDLEIVILDFSGNETTEKISVDPEWINNMTEMPATVEIRRFRDDGKNGPVFD